MNEQLCEMADERMQEEAEMELYHACAEALIRAATGIARPDDIRVLCYRIGIPYERISAEMILIQNAVSRCGSTQRPYIAA
jgi:hypothetical protein